MDLEQILDIIKANGYKITKTRQAIISSLLLSQNNFLSVDSILGNIKKLNKNINLTTIYRNLEILQSLNLIHKSISNDGIALYQLANNDNHHHHLICKYCGRTEPIEFCPMNQLIQISNDKDFTITEHKIELYGLCKQCNKK